MIAVLEGVRPSDVGQLADMRRESTVPDVFDHWGVNIDGSAGDILGAGPCKQYG